jgi:hypothetical protein
MTNQTTTEPKTMTNATADLYEAIGALKSAQTDLRGEEKRQAEEATRQVTELMFDVKATDPSDQFMRVNGATCNNCGGPVEVGYPLCTPCQMISKMDENTTKQESRNQ